MSQSAVFRVAARIEISLSVNDHGEVVSAADFDEDLLGAHPGGFGDGFAVADSELTVLVGAKAEDDAVISQDESVGCAGGRVLDLVVFSENGKKKVGKMNLNTRRTNSPFFTN